jgi:hypothetical protein
MTSVSPLAIPESTIFQAGTTMRCPKEVVDRAMYLRRCAEYMLPEEKLLTRLWDIVTAALIDTGACREITQPPRPPMMCPGCKSTDGIARESYHSCCIACGLVIDTHYVQDVIETRRMENSGHSGYAAHAPRPSAAAKAARDTMEKIRIPEALQRRVMSRLMNTDKGNSALETTAALVVEFLTVWAAEYKPTQFGVLRRMYGTWGMAYRNLNVCERVPSM